MPTLTPSTRIFVAGHRGMVGSAVVRALQARNCRRLVLQTRQETDLCDEAATEAFFAREKPEVVILAAARVGGILANSTYPAEFLQENLASALHVIHQAWRHGTRRLLFLGSSCIYPQLAPQPMTEDCLLTGPLEPTNEPYAIAKIAGLKLCQYYRQQYGVTFHSVMPTNLYGPGDLYHPQHAHVIPGMIRRFHLATVQRAPEVVLWGSGNPRREFLHVDDLAQAILLLLEMDDPPDWVNAGSGSDLTIRDLATLIARTTGYTGRIDWDTTRPDGPPRKLLDSSRLFATGWRPIHDLESGLRDTLADFRQSLENGTVRNR